MCEDARRIEGLNRGTTGATSYTVSLSDSAEVRLAIFPFNPTGIFLNSSELLIPYVLMSLDTVDVTTVTPEPYLYPFPPEPYTLKLVEISSNAACDPR